MCLRATGRARGKGWGQKAKEECGKEKEGGEGRERRLQGRRDRERQRRSRPGERRGHRPRAAGGEAAGAGRGAERGWEGRRRGPPPDTRTRVAGGDGRRDTPPAGDGFC